MLIKYCIKDSDNCKITEITNAEHCGDGSVLFIPLRGDLLNIVIENVSDSEFYEIFETLFHEERADLTAYKNRTTYLFRRF